jgi:O-antigen ligase
MGLLTTHSRGGTVALIAVGGLLVFLRLPIRWMPWLAALGLLGFLVACSRGGAGMLDASARERVVFWGYANWAFKQNPIFGIGYGMFWQISEDRAAHNAFVHCYTEMGLVGYWFWFNLLLLGVIGCWRTRMAVRKPRTPEQRHLRRLAGMGLASMAGFSAGAYFLSRTFVFPFFFLFALLNAVPLIARNLLPSDHPPLIDTRRDVLVYGTIATLASVVYIYVSILLLNR